MMRFDRLDLNLLVALDVLLTERSVSNAAERLYLSQSATSSALGRLRDYFGDHLLVLKGRTMELTPRAEDLVEPVRAVLEQIRSTIAVAPPFDPATSDRRITIMATDYATEVLFSRAARYFAREAPHMTFEIMPLADNVIDCLNRRTMDLLLTLDVSVDSNHPRQALFEDEFVVVGFNRNPHLNAGITREAFVQLGHVATIFGRTRLLSFPDWILSGQIPNRKIEFYSPTFLTIPSLVMGTERVALMPRRIAEKAAQHLPIRIVPSPISMPTVNMSGFWHPANDRDEAIRWVVSVLSRAGSRDERPAIGTGEGLPGTERELSREYTRLACSHTRH